MRIEALTPVVAAAPGDRVTCRVRVTNDGSTPTRYEVRVVGLDALLIEIPGAVAPLAAGAADELDIALTVPEAFAAGRHAVAVEVVSARAGEPPALAAITLAVDTLDQVGLAIVPSTIRGRRRGRFALEIRNRQPAPVELELTGEGHGLRVRLARRRVVVGAGEEVQLRGRVAGPPNIFGETLQHVVTVVARGRSAPGYASATYRQRPLIPRPLRTAVAILTVLALWAGVVGYGAWRWTHRDRDPSADAANLQDSDGDGIPDVEEDSDGDGVPDVEEDSDGDGVPDVAEDSDGDGVPDVEEDSDGDGIPDVAEDSDGDGIPDSAEDTDGDGIPDSAEDSDSDGIPDAEEDTDGATRPTATLIAGTVKAAKPAKTKG